MKVFLVPIGADQHELYCEVVDTEDDPVGEEGGAEQPGFFRRLRDRFASLLKEAERHRHDASHTRDDSSWGGRLRSRILRWVAESMAEQRLQWHLRKQSAACLVHPADLDGVTAIVRLRAQLQRDFQKHRFWLVLDSLFFVGSGVLVIVPGPNVLAYYLGFRLVGHYFSLRGARRGLDAVTWTTESSPVLAELRSAIRLDREQRARRIHDLADQLALEHLASFVERAAPTPS